MVEPDFVIVAGDTWPPLEATLTDRAGAPIDLTGATVHLVMRPVVVGTAPALDGAATVVGLPTAGAVRYDWQAGDTDAAGEYEAAWRIAWTAGATATVPNDAHPIRVLITGRLA